MVSLNLFRKRQVKSSILDVPLESYDQTTGLPTKIQIGDQNVKPFVSLQETKDHLTFLSALSSLQNSLPSADINSFTNLCQQSAKAYAYWAQHTINSRKTGMHLTHEELPSLEILMAWHTHLLNPTIYNKDIAGAYSNLEGLDFPLSAVAMAIRQNTLLTYQPINADQEVKLKQSVWSYEDIGKAIERQAKFIGNMKRIGWLNDAYWGKGLMELQFSIVLYHAWLDLMQSTQSRYFLVPRLDIDLAWHTHQLHHIRYKSDTEKVLGAFLNHNDAAGDEKVGDGLEVTKKLWKKRFGWDYQ
ncbi:uncharacterized protein L201_006665 [Kwoniella dendrophila CBS 6074]|uniref:Uncharacterized protein n=1 Tax=Kwoniella dendrophila CBS 6074 TaxID=1295534 RepID=A0AAX4K3P1_9TREE